MLDVKQMLSHIVDNLKTLNTKTEICVVESGTTNGWRYKKFSDGTFEAWREYNGSMTLTTAVGSLYTSANTVSVSMPTAINITDILHANVTVLYGGYPVWTALRAATPSSLTFQALSTASRTQNTYPIQVYMYGTYS